MIDAPLQTDAKPATVLIVDGQPAVREGLANRISHLSDLQVCGEAGDVESALAIVSHTIPDLAIVDIDLKGGSGIELIKLLKDANPALYVLVWSMQADTIYAERALRAGAEGYINKDQATDHVIRAIRHILGGRIYLNELLADQLLRRSLGRIGEIQSSTPIVSLSHRELETYRLIGEGLSTREVAHRMITHVRTVETYLARIKKKFHFENRQQLVHAAVQWTLENR